MFAPGTFVGVFSFLWNQRRCCPFQVCWVIFRIMSGHWTLLNPFFFIYEMKHNLSPLTPCGLNARFGFGCKWLKTQEYWLSHEGAVFVRDEPRANSTGGVWQAGIRRNKVLPLRAAPLPMSWRCWLKVVPWLAHPLSQGRQEGGTRAKGWLT